MFKTLVGAFKNKDIRKKIIYTLLILVVVRVGSLLPIPGVDTNYFSSLLSGVISVLSQEVHSKECPSLR